MAASAMVRWAPDDKEKNKTVKQSKSLPIFILFFVSDLFKISTNSVCFLFFAKINCLFFSFLDLFKT